MPATAPDMSTPPPQPDIESKMRLYGAIAAMRRSRLPTNAQIADALEYVHSNSPVDEKKLSKEGQRLVGDIRDIIATFSGLLQHKNSGELIQRFVWATRRVDTSRLNPDEAEKAKGKQDVDRAKSDAQEATQHLRTLLSLVLTNAEMRKLITDAGTVGRDLLAKSAAKAAEGIAPHPDALARADEPGPNDHFHDDDPLKKGEQLSKAARARAASGSSDEVLTSDDEEVEKKKKTLLSRIQGLHSSNKDKVDEGRNWLADEFFPEERRERWIWRGKKVIVECQKHQDYNPSVSWLLNTIDAWARQMRDHAATSASTTKDGSTANPNGASKEQVSAKGGVLPLGTLAQDESLQHALELLRTLLERIANAPLEPIFSAARVLAQDAANDESLKRWWTNVDVYIRKVLLQVGYVTEPACSDKARELRDTGRTFYNEKYKGHFDALLDASSAWFKAIGEDKLNQAFGQDVARLTKDLLFDSEGNLQFKKKLWDDVRNVILPTLVDRVGYIPIPRIEYTDDKIDLVVENLTLSGRHLFPNVVEVEAHNYARFSPYDEPDVNAKATKNNKKKGDVSKHEFTFTFAQIHADMRDVAFEFRTKAGIKMKDSGLADVVLGGDGLTATVTLTSSKDTTSVFRVADVRVKVGSLKFRIRDSKHDLLYKTLKPLATGLVKKQIKKALEDAIRTGFEYVDGQLVGVRDRMDEAKESEDGNRGQVIADMFKRKKEEAETVDAKSANSVSAGNSQFKVTASKQDSLLPQSGHPSGWVNKTPAMEKLAARGDEWRSDAFDIKPKPVVAPGIQAKPQTQARRV